MCLHYKLVQFGIRNKNGQFLVLATLFSFLAFKSEDTWLYPICLWTWFLLFNFTFLLSYSCLSLITLFISFIILFCSFIIGNFVNSTLKYPLNATTYKKNYKEKYYTKYVLQACCTEREICCNHFGGIWDCISFSLQNFTPSPQTTKLSSLAPSVRCSGSILISSNQDNWSMTHIAGTILINIHHQQKMKLVP